MDRAGPDLLRPDAGKVDRRGAVHAGGLRRVGVELIAGDHLDPMLLPIDPAMLVTVAHRLFLNCNLALYGCHCERSEAISCRVHTRPRSPECEAKMRAADA